MLEQNPSNFPAIPADMADRQAESPAWRRARNWSWFLLGQSKGFEWNRLELAVPGLPAALHGLRIVHLSDVHLGANWLANYDVFLNSLQKAPPDLLLFTGDLVDAKLDHRPALAVAERFVSRLTARLGVFGITGNHDGDLLGPRLHAWKMQFIPRKHVHLENHEAKVELVGLPGVRRTSFDPDWIMKLPPRQHGVPRLVLSHYPDQIRLIGPLEADLMLAGHTHGGQICLPNGRALMTHDELPKQMARGAHRFGPTTLVVNRGFGMTKWPLRIFCPPEVVEIRLVAA